jgi:drug/metabolite transporter, DME family
MTPTPSINPVRRTISGILAVLLAAACWGSSGIFIKLIMTAGPVSSLLLAFWRDATAFLVFFSLAVALDHRQLRIRRSDWSILAGMGISLGVFHVALNLGYRLNGAAITTIQQAAMPAIVLVAARILWKEPLTAMKIFSLILICIGTVLVSGLIRTGVFTATGAGILVGFLVPVLYAGWSLFGKALRTGYSAVGTLSWAFGIATLILLPCQLATATIFPAPLPLISFLWFAGLIFISTAGGFFAFIFALGRLPAGMATILAMSEIAFAVVYARIILGETLSLMEIGGTIVIVAGVITLLDPKEAAAASKPAFRR